MNTPAVQNIFITIMTAVSPFLMAAFSWLVVKATQWVQARTKNELVAGILTRVLSFVDVTVRSLEQTVVDEMKKAAEDGVITAEEATSIKKAALDNVKKLLGPKGLEEVVKILGIGAGGVDKFLGDHIEAMVQRVQAAKAPVTAVVATTESAPEPSGAPRAAAVVNP